jgi:hypothetical protein
LRDVRSILDAHYLARDPALADNAIRKLERGTDFSNRSQTGQVQNAQAGQKALQIND